MIIPRLLLARSIVFVVAILPTAPRRAAAQQASVPPSLPPRDNRTSVLLGDTLVETSAGALPPANGHPMQMGARISVRDTTTGRLHRRTLALPACPFAVRIYRRGAAEGRPAWNSAATTGSTKCPVIQRNEGPGTRLGVDWNVADVLGDSLSAGWYEFRYTLTTADGRTFPFVGATAYLSADSARPTSDLRAVQFSASSEITGAGPRTLRTVVVARNNGRRWVELSYAACAVKVRLYRMPARDGEPAWRSERRQTPGSRFGEVCLTSLTMNMIPPGDSVVFPLSVPMYEVIGDTLTNGGYYASAELTLVDPRPAQDASRDVVRVLDAGAMDIVRQAERLPSSLVVDGLVYTATTGWVRGDTGEGTIRTLVRVSNPTSLPHGAKVSRACPVLAFGYRSEARRDSVPFAAPLSYPSPGCSGVPDYPYMLPPGESWVFARDVDMTAARAAIGPGHLWFTAWLLGSPDLKIAAGDVEVPPA